MKFVKNDNSKIFAQLCKAQSQFTEIVKNKEAKASPTKDGRQFGGYRYAELSQVLASILPALNANDLFLAQPVHMEGDRFVLSTFIGNCDGETIELGSIGYSINGLTLQDIGKAITYLRRYHLLSTFGLGTEDDDANGLGHTNDTVLPAAKPKPAEPADVSDREINAIIENINEVSTIADLVAIGKEQIKFLPQHQQEMVRPIYKERMSSLKTQSGIESDFKAA